MRERNHDHQSERERRFGGGEREGFRRRGEGERYVSRDWRDDEAFGDESESQGFEGRAGQGGWREDQGAYGNYGQSGRQGDPFRQQGQFDPYRGGAYGQGRGQGGDYGPQRDFGRQDFGRQDPGRQGWERRQEYGIDRNEGYGSPQGYGSQRYGQGFESERFGQGYGSQGQGFGQGQRGRFTGRGPKGWQRSDESVLERVNETLEQHPDIDASEIEVTCARGEIVLRGTVDDRRAKRLAEDALENLPGVKDVRNEIRVQERQGQGQQGQAGQQTGGPGAQQAGHNGGGRSRSAT